jgi:hypothetical protein
MSLAKKLAIAFVVAGLAGLVAAVPEPFQAAAAEIARLVSSALN